MPGIAPKHARLCIAETCFSVTLDQSSSIARWEAVYQDFCCTAEPEVTIHAQYSGVPQVPLRDEDRIFDSQAAWSPYRVNGANVFVQKDRVPGPTSPYFIAIFDDRFTRGEVHWLVRESERSAVDGLLPYPLDYPFGEVLMICLLALGRGLMVHACGIDDGERGYLFAGNSGHGKTTMARLWREHARILNDDRIVLRHRDGRLWMYGTPWHGEHTGVSPHGVPLEKVFFLRRAEANSVRRKAGVAASSMLLTRCFPPLWDAEGMRFTLDFCAQLVTDAPCYELGFLPDETVLDVVRCAK